MPHEGRIAWIWALFFAFAVPELGTMIRAGRIVFFRNIRRCKWAELLLVATGELGHVLGLGLLTFVVLPELDALKAVMLTNAMSLVPAILSKFALYSHKVEMYIVVGLQICSPVRTSAAAARSSTKLSICSPFPPSSPVCWSGRCSPPPPNRTSRPSTCCPLPLRSSRCAGGRTTSAPPAGWNLCASSPLSKNASLNHATTSTCSSRRSSCCCSSASAC